jgi:hypothetical protein
VPFICIFQLLVFYPAVRFLRMSGLVMFYHPEKGLLLDNNVGVSKYDYDTHSFVSLAPISKRERRLLSCMMAHDDIPLSREMLLSLVWRGRTISDNSINVSISRLRCKLKWIDSNSGCVAAVRNDGYIFYTRRVGLIPIRSLDFLLSSLLWSKHVRGHQ